MREGTVPERVDHILEFNDRPTDTQGIPENKQLPLNVVLHRLLARSKKSKP